VPLISATPDMRSRAIDISSGLLPALSRCFISTFVEGGRAMASRRLDMYAPLSTSGHPAPRSIRDFLRASRGASRFSGHHFITPSQLRAPG